MRFPWSKTSTVEELAEPATAPTPEQEPAATLVAPTAEEAPMPTDDFSDVHAAVTPDTPATGDTVTVAVTGVDHHTDTSEGSIGPLTLALNAGGAESSLTVDAVPYTIVSKSDVDVVLVGVTDPSGRTWTVAADGKSATATA